MILKSIVKFTVLLLFLTSCGEQSETNPDSQDEDDVFPQIDSQNVAFCEHAIGFRFPTTSTDYDFYDNQMNGVIGHLRLDQSEVLPFLSKYPFIKQDKTEATCIGLSDLRLENQTIPNGTFFTTGKKNEHINWVIYFHKESGRVWVYAGYQDTNG